MAKHRRQPLPPPPPTGILAGVLNFVAREFDSFVASATGTYPAGPSGSDAVNDVDESDDYDSQESDEPAPPRKRTRTHRSAASRRRSASSSLEVPDNSHSRKRKEYGSEDEEEGSRPKPTSRRRKEHGDSIYPSIDDLRAEENQGADADVGSQGSVPAPHPRDSTSPGPTDESDDDAHGQRPSSPTPLPLAAILKRKPSMTMPGSLFPRSPSLEPESKAAEYHRVRFSSARRPAKSSLHQSSTLHQAGSHSPSPSPPATPSRAHSHDHALEDPATPPRRQHLSSGIKSVVDRFHDEGADPSILLPSPQTSPVAKGTTQYLHSPHSSHGHGHGDADVIEKVDKGKGRAIDPDSSGMLRVMGKEQELVAARARLDRNLRTREDDVNEQTFILEQAEKDREADRERIRMLEQEIEWLKGELSKRPSGPIHIDITPHPPAPPPPPPPPPKTIITIPSVITDPNLFASARASLNHAPTPVEKPILQPRRKTGIATVGLAPEKMAAFLKEMKTVRLRKTGGDRPGSGFDSAANATFTAPTPPTRVDTIPPRRSYSLQRPAMSAPLVDPTPITSISSRLPFKTTSVVGEKRKRTTTTEEPRTARKVLGKSADRSAEATSSKRPSTTGSANQSFESTSTSNTSSQSMHNQEAASSSLPPPRSQKPASQITITTNSQPRQPSSVTDAPTPSLCSDNDGDHDRDGDNASQDDKLLSTPPLDQSFLGPSRSFYRFRGNGIPVDSDASDREKEKERRASMAAKPKPKQVLHAHVGDISRRRLPSPSPAPASAPALERRSENTAVAAAATSTSAVGVVTETAPRTTTAPIGSTGKNAGKNTGANKNSTTMTTNTSVFANRAPVSPMPEKSPRRPRLPSRTVNTNSAPSHAPAPVQSVPKLKPLTKPLSKPPSKPLSKPRPPTPPRRRSRPVHSDADADSGEDLDAPLAPVYTTPAVMVYSSSSESGDKGETRDGGRVPEAGPSKPRSGVIAVWGEREKEREREVSATPLAARVARASASSSRSVHGGSGRARQAARRRTLDEELRSAVPFLHEGAEEEEEEEEEQQEEEGEEELQQEDGDEQEHAEYEEREEEEEHQHYTNTEYHDKNDPHGLESGVLVDVGTRSTRRGFLAHGGAGGPPVFMGVGYVEGAQDEEEEEEFEPVTVATPFEARSKNRAPRRSRPAPPSDDDDEYIPSPPARKNRPGRR